jgi:hypothetical protein
MAMTTCSECQGKISDQALICPHCGIGLKRALETFSRLWPAPRPAPGVEKRRYPRIEIKTLVHVDGEKTLLFNISRGGMLLSSPSYPKGPDVHITLEAGEEEFTLKGVVRWVSGKRSFSNLIDFGVEIIFPPAGYREFVERLESC